MALLIKTLNGLAYGSVKTKNGLSTASIKTINGIDATGFVPTDIAGCEFWVAGNLIVGLNDGDPVSSWADQSGNGNNATQGTGASQPLYETNELNGFPVVRFDGSNDFLDATVAASTTAYTRISVFQWDTSQGTGAFRVALNFGPGASANTTFTGIDPSGFYISSHSAAGNDLPSGVSSGWIVASVVVSAGTIEWWLDGASVGSSSTDVLARGSNLARLGNYGSGSFYFKGDIAEDIIYDAALNSTDRQTVENYLLLKYGL